MRKELKRRINKVMNELQAMKELIDSDALQEQPEVDIDEEIDKFMFAPFQNFKRVSRHCLVDMGDGKEWVPVYDWKITTYKRADAHFLRKFARHFYELGLKAGKEQKPVEIHIDNPNIQKIDPNVKISISDSSADGEELLYVCNKSYKIGYRDGVNSVKPAEWQRKKDEQETEQRTNKEKPYL